MDQIKNGRAILLTRDTCYQAIHDLWRALPPPMSDDADDLVNRDNAAMAEGASLLPADSGGPADATILGTPIGRRLRHGRTHRWGTVPNTDRL